jgi:OOP family OmpA-OmpF porin
MRVALKLTLVSALAALAPGLPLDRASAAESELGVLMGVLLSDENLSGNWDEANDASPLIGLRTAARWTRVGLFMDGVYSPIDPPQPITDGSQFLFRGGVEVFGPPHWGGGDTFFAAGAGLMHMGLDGQESLDKFLVSLGIGHSYRLSERGRLRWEFRGDHVFVGDEEEFVEDDITQFEFLIGAGAVFGGSSGDEDGDGVSDDIDDCPDTPKHWPVDGRGCPLDSDDDGVPDGADSCPNTPHGALVDKKGCPSDSDRDGVFNGIDQCPNTPSNTDVDDRGCPLDSDKDGVPDGIDKCPDTPRNVRVDANGCPIAKPLFTPEKKALILQGVNFGTDSEKLTEDSRDTLDKVAESLKAYPDVRVEIGGHTDARNSNSYNLDLSQRRAESVKSYLVQQGVDPSQLEVKGYGESKPIASNKTVAGMAKNRRVELKKID